MYWYLYLEGDTTPVAIDGSIFGEQRPLFGRGSDPSPAETPGRNSKEDV